MRTAVHAAVATLVAAIIGGLGLLAKRGCDELTATGLEQIWAGVALAVGIAFGGRLGVHCRIGYLRWKGKPENGWTTRKRHLLTAITVANVPLTLALCSAGAYFFFERNGVLELGVLVALAILVGLSINQTMNLIEEGGPPRGSDVIGECRPVKWLARSTKHWNRVWGVKHVVQLVKNTLPPDHSSKLAIVMVSALLLGCVGMTVAIVLRDHEQGSKISRKKNSPERREDSARMENKDPAPDDADAASAEVPTRCNEGIRAGEGAPELRAEELRISWEEKGPGIAGCPRRARAIAGGDAYAMENFCYGEFKSLTVTSAAYPAETLLDDAAVKAKEMANRGELQGVSVREDVRSGDALLFYTAMGPFVLIREQKTDGHGAPDHSPKDCRKLKPAREKYLAMAPGMAEIWLEFVELVAPVWPKPDLDEGTPGFNHLEFKTVAGVTIAWGFCYSKIDCVLTGASLSLRSKGTTSETVTMPRLLARMGA